MRHPDLEHSIFIRQKSNILDGIEALGILGQEKQWRDKPYYISCLLGNIFLKVRL